MVKSGTKLGLDAFDAAILKIVQRDNQRSHAAIGEQVGLSGSAVRRRLSAMRRSGVITQDVSILGPALSGVTLIVSVAFGHESPEIYDRFETQMRSLDEVQQCYHVAGALDFVLIVVMASLEAYEDWAKRQFMANEAIKRYDTTVVWSCKKFTTARPVTTRS